MECKSLKNQWFTERTLHANFHDTNEESQQRDDNLNALNVDPHES
jgi:hypothetical protein